MFSKIAIAISVACLVAVSAAGVAVLLEARALLRDIRGDVAIIDRNVTDTLNLTRQAAGSAAEASAQANLAAQEQRTYWQKTSLETYKTMASLRLTIVRADKNINDVLAPQLVTTLKATDALARQASVNLQTAMNGLQPSLDNLARASSAAADTMADPHIRESLAHVDAASAQLEASSVQLAGVATNLDAASKDAAEAVHRATRPASLIVTIAEKAFGLAVGGAQLYYGTHK
jgi:hypothetical protein